VYQDEDHIDKNNIPSDVQTFLSNPYNLEMMEKSIKSNKIEIFPNLVKDGDNAPTSFDQTTLFRQISKGGGPILPTSNTTQATAKEKEPTVRTSDILTSSVFNQRSN